MGGVELVLALRGSVLEVAAQHGPFMARPSATAAAPQRLRPRRGRLGPP